MAIAATVLHIWLVLLNLLCKTACAGPIYTLKDSSDWLKLNGRQYGLYRVQYPQNLWNRLTGAARAGPANLSATDYAGLLDDSYVLATSGTEPITTFLVLSVYAAPEPP